jgi:hypothetical protein
MTAPDVVAVLEGLTPAAEEAGIYYSSLLKSILGHGRSSAAS